MVCEGIERAGCSSQKALFIKIDFAKAYDRIEWPFILAKLKDIGFGPRFIQSIQIIFGDAFACIIINGSHSLSFDLHRSIRQGFPLAPSLYVLAVEGFRYFVGFVIFAGHVRGISLFNSPSQLVNGHFANDLFLTLLKEENNAKEALHCLEIFCLASRSAIQWHKTQYCRNSFLPTPLWLSQFGWK